jgi:hypothetical protein
MRRRAVALVLAVGVTGALAAGGGLAAWANWSVGSSVTPFTAASARIPAMSPPHAELDGDVPEIEWTGVQLAPGRPVGGYVVIRQDGADRAVACTVAASVTDCRDSAAVAGDTVTYVVHATLGANWAGKDSGPSDPVQIPAPVTLASGHKEPIARPAPSPTAPEVKQPKESPAPSESASPSPSPSVSSSAAGAADVSIQTD